MFVQFGRKIRLNQTLKRSIFTDKLCTNFQLIGYVRLVRFEKLLVLLHISITEKRKHVVLNFLRKDLVLSSLRPEMMNYSVFVFDISSVENIHEISSFREYISIHYEGKVRWNKISYVDFIQPCSIRAVCIMWMDCITRMRPFPLPPPPVLSRLKMIVLLWRWISWDKLHKSIIFVENNVTSDDNCRKVA